MNSSVGPIITGAISASAVYLIWQFNFSPSGFAPYGLMLVGIISFFAIVGACAGFVIGNVSYDFLSRYAISDDIRAQISSLFTAIIIGFIALTLYLIWP